MPISPLTKRQIAQQRTAASFPCLIEITSGNDPKMFYTNASENITFEGNVYNAATFSIQPPDRDGSTIGDATLTISAIDQVWPEKIRGTQKPAKLRFIAVIVYREGNIAGIERLEENSFTLRTANWNRTSVTWAMHFDENMAVIVPAEKCNAQTTPGIS
jgi:hypothetical protein